MKVQNKKTGRILEVSAIKECENYILCIDTVEPFIFSKKYYKNVDAQSD